MANVHAIESNGAGIQSVYDIVTDREFDYFESERAARAHAQAEGVDLAELTPTGGANGNAYIKVPRLYPENLDYQLVSASVVLGVNEKGTVFLHADRDAITLGRNPVNHLPGQGHEGRASFVAPADGRSASIHVLSPDFVRYSFLPGDEEAGTAQASFLKGVDLSLGRDILVTGMSSPEDEERAARDVFRDWESVLVVGSGTVSSFIKATLVASETSDSPRKDALTDGLRAVTAESVLEGLVHLNNRQLNIFQSIRSE